ncbi:MAG: hypothetical protein LR015_02170 [Verrucomicrobia bacterium]|nr:hypothetical protein [Verrucomicrobiota bacterium]
MSESSNITLSEAEIAFMEYFVRIAQAFSLPRSLGELFGYLFAQAEPVSFDHIFAALGQSKGSVSMGLRTLQRLQAVRTEYKVGDRRTYYVAETSLRRLLGGIMEDTILPQLRTSNESLNLIEQQIDTTSNPTDKAILQDRLKRLRHWTEKSQTALTLLNKFFPLH